MCLQGKRVDVVLDRAVPYQLDGDTAGEARGFTAEVDHASILVMAPR